MPSLPSPRLSAEHRGGHPNPTPKGSPPWGGGGPGRPPGPHCPTAHGEGCLGYLAPLRERDARAPRQPGPPQHCGSRAQPGPGGPTAPWRGARGHWVCVVRAVPSCCLRVGPGSPGPRAVLCKDRFFNSVLSAFKYLHLALCT